jgi:hypothetical protein
MRRHIRRVLVGTSLILCVGTLLLWGRSYYSRDLLELHRRGGGDARGRAYDDVRGVVSSGGSLGAGYVRISHPNRPSFAAGWVSAASRPDDAWWPRRFNLMGFSYWSVTLPANRKNGGVHATGFAVPHALVAALLAIPPALAARRHVLARRENPPELPLRPARHPRPSMLRGARGSPVFVRTLALALAG